MGLPARSYEYSRFPAAFNDLGPAPSDALQKGGAIGRAAGIAKQQWTISDLVNLAQEWEAMEKSEPAAG
jgi:hypothetical protein